MLGIDSNRVVCRVKRLGGGFGGKETRSVFISCGLAVAAKKLGRPVRCMLSREEDMAVSGDSIFLLLSSKILSEYAVGMRHPFMSNYKVGFTDEGRIVFLESDIFNNAGYSMDLSLGTLFLKRNCKAI